MDCFRRIRFNKAERALFVEQAEFTRAKRNPKNIPQEWDDVTRGDWNGRCWKHKKVTRQWQKNL